LNTYKKSTYINLAKEVVDAFKELPAVEAIALGGSQAFNSVDECSDIDLYVFSDEKIPFQSRQKIVENLRVRKSDLNLTFWDLGDEWFDARTGIEVDIIYWDKSWIIEQIDRVLVSQQANVGYTTCLWFTVLNSKIMYDRDGWFAQLQNRCEQPYPEKLRNAIIARNHPVLRNVIPSYYNQIKKAIHRDDYISINHRIAALFASYFDVLFAINCLPNPGEKKVLEHVLTKCSKIPEDFTSQAEAVFKSVTGNCEKLLANLDVLLNSLDNLLIDEGINPARTLELDTP